MDPNPPTPLGERLRASRSNREEDARRRRSAWTRRILLGLVVAGAILGAPAAYRATARWRADSLSAQAGELIRQQSFPEAVSRLESALKVDPSCPTALRHLADIYSRFELPAALPVLRALASGPDRTEEDVHDFMEAAIRLQRFDLVEDELSRLLARTNVSIRTRTVATEYFYRLGDLPRALAFANDVRKTDPTNHVHQIRAARILASTPSPERRNDAIQIIRSLSNPSPNERIEILDMLGNTPTLGRTQVAAALEAFPEPPNASPLEYFLRATLRIRLDPKTKDAVIEEAFQRARKGSPEFRSDLATWLVQNSEFQRILSGFTPEEAAKQPGIFTNYIEAVARSGRWAEVQQLAVPGAALDPWVIDGFRAVAAERLNQRGLAEESWRRAFEAAGTHPARLRALGDLALRHDVTDAAIKAFTLLSENKLQRGAAFRRLAAVHERRHDAVALRAVMQSWAAGSDHPAPEQAYCYLSGLLATDVESVLPRARRLFDRMPSRLPYRATLALLELRRGDTSAAAALFEKAAINPATATPQTRMIEAMILAATGNAPKAKEIATGISTNSLLPQELEIVKRLTGN